METGQEVIFEDMYLTFLATLSYLTVTTIPIQLRKYVLFFIPCGKISIFIKCIIFGV